VIAGVRYARIFWIGAAGAIVLAALIGISALLRSDFTETDGQILLTLLCLLVASGAAVAGLTVVERGHDAIGWGAVAIAIVSFFFLATWTWDGFDDETLGKVAGTSAFALVVTLLCTTQLVLHRGQHVWVVLITWVALLLAFVTSSAGIWQEHSSDGTWQAAGSFWIVGVMGWLLLPVVQRFTAAAVPPGEVRVLGALDGVELVASRAPVEGIRVEAPSAGERLVLRRRAS
jgi:hypothetical protein